jgi:hypothetical protein
MESIVKNADWELLKQDDGTLLLVSADQTLKLSLTKKQLLGLTAILEAAKNVE